MILITFYVVIAVFTLLRNGSNVHLGGSSMKNGTVKWYRKTTGYGLIAPDDGSEDIFVHFSSIANRKLRVLVKGQSVTFEVKKGPTGPLAINVQCAF